MKFPTAKIKKIAPLLIIAAASLWALDGIVRRSLYHLPPITIVFYEHLIGSLILLPVVISNLRKAPKGFLQKKITRELILTVFLVALFGGLLGTLFITTALAKVHFIAFSVVFLIQKLQPLFAILAAAILLKEKITKGYLKWALLALLAAFFVTFPGGRVNFATPAILAAALYAFGAAAVWGTGTVFSKMLLNQVSSTSGTILRFYVTTFLAFIAVFVLGAQGSLSQVGASEVSRLIYIAFSTGLLAMLLYYQGLKYTQAKVSTIFELALPLLAVFVDMFLYHNFLAWSQYLAAGVLLFAMYRVGKLKS